MVVAEIRHYQRMDQQGGIEFFRIQPYQQLHFVRQFGEQFVGGTRRGHRITNLLVVRNRFGERASIEPDDGTLQPAAGIGNAFPVCGVYARHQHGARGMRQCEDILRHIAQSDAPARSVMQSLPPTGKSRQMVGRRE